MINKKQLKISFYLYTWSDLNILSSFEVYLQDRDLDEFVDTLYAIDYNYYLNEIYEIDHTEVEQFNKDIEIQLIILFLYEGYIESTDERMSLEKFIRAGDKTVINLYLNLKIDQNELIKKLIDLTKLKKQELDNIHSNDNIKELSNEEKKKERSILVDQILAARFKSFSKKDKLKYLINHNEPLLKSMFDLLDQNGDQVQWVNSFSAYLQTVEQTHIKMVIEQLALQGGLDTIKIYECRPQLIKGIYENHLLTNDSADSIDTLERAIRKLAKSRDVRGSPK